MQISPKAKRAEDGIYNIRLSCTVYFSNKHPNFTESVVIISKIGGC